MDWNQMSNSDDSWLQQDDSEDEGQKVQATNVSKPQESSDKHSSTEIKSSSIETLQKKDPIKKQKQERRQGKKDNRKFPTDQELLEQYQKGTIQQAKRIKVINFSEDDKKMIETMLKDKKIKKIRPLKENILILSFWNKEDLIKFIQNKIELSSRFKIGVYVISQKEREWKAQIEKQRIDERKREEKKEEREHRGKKQQYRGKNEVESDKKQEQRKQPKKKQKWEQEGKKDRKENTKHKNEHKFENKPEQKYKERDNEKKHKQIKNLHLEKERSNIVQVASDEGNPCEVVQWLKNKQIPKQFNQFVFKAAGNLVQYMDKICQECHKTLNYGLTSDISEEECQKNPEGIFEYRLTSQKKPKQVKKLLGGVYIERVGQEYFEAYQKFNTHIIGSKKNLSDTVEFDEKDYIESFKKSYPKLVTKWEKWIFYAYGRNIAKLLRLSGTMKKLLQKNQFAYEIGSEQKVPYVRFEIIDFNKTKYKVDTSLVNSHLQDA